MTGLIKIGITYSEDIKTRMNQLYNTNVLFPFEVACAAKVNNPLKVESVLHIAFGPH
ncbi:MAG: GIY-YIG nuclease family protein [Bacteroidia bacterium]|nr:GIY-YIG nuclease family protein [Bacteroidia bacterium]